MDACIMRGGRFRAYKPHESRALKICATLQQGERLEFYLRFFELSAWDAESREDKR